MFCDLRDSTDILLNFEQSAYSGTIDGEPASYDRFLYDVHKTSYEYLYLGHEQTHTEIYGDGLMAIFPADNAKYIMENIYRLTARMRSYNEAQCTGVKRPAINLGFGITIGDIAMMHYYLDDRDHPIGIGVHEAARIEARSKFYDARILISERFYQEAAHFIDADPRFDCRFIDRICLKHFREPVSLYELLLDNDPRFEAKVDSVTDYSAAYAHYCSGEWDQAKQLFLKVYNDYGLGSGQVMANRCDLLSQQPPGHEWRGIWSMADK